MALIDIDDLQAFKAIGGNDSAAAEVCIEAVDAWLKRAIGYEIESATFTERMNGSGTEILKPKRWPITAVTTLKVDDYTWTVLLYTNATDSDEEAFLPSHGKWLEARNGDVFSAGVGNVLMVYTAGYTTTTMPEDLKMSACMLGHLLLGERNKIGDAAKSMGMSGEQIQSIARNAKDYEFIDKTIERMRRR